MIVLFIMMVIGYVSYKKGLITEQVNKKLSGIVVYIANPALTLSGTIGTDNYIEGKELITTLVIVFAMYVALLVLAVLIPKLLFVSKKSEGTYRAMMVFSNIGFMGFPIIAAVYGNGALLYACLFTIAYNILIYTYGISAVTAGNEEAQNARKQEKLVPKLKRIFNIGVVASLLAIVIYLLKLQMPTFVVSTVKNLSNLTAPLSMMVIGASLATIAFKELFTDVKLLLFSLIKLVILPIIGLWIIKRFISDPILLGVCMVMLATPVGSMTAMLAQQYDGDYEMASKGVALTTIFSVLTMPLISAILPYL